MVVLAGRTHAQALAACLGPQFPGALGGGGGLPVPGALTWGMLLQIQDIVRRRQLLTIFREGKGRQQDVDVAILQALLKGEGRRGGTGAVAGTGVLRTLTCSRSDVRPGGRPVGAPWRCGRAGVFLSLPF